MIHKCLRAAVLCVLLAGFSGMAEANKTPEVYGPEPTLANVSYGEHERHVLDFWKPESDKPTPVVFYIHGGSWRGRDKIDARAYLDIAALLEEDIAVVSISYRLEKYAKEVVPFVKAPMEDSARALQFVRSKAEEWNLDKDRVGVTGVSAGGCTALWLAYHDDMADPDSDDPVARESTRVTCVVVDIAQTSLDPKQVLEWMPKATYGAHAFNLNSLAECLEQRERILPWINEYSPAALASKDDPPTVLRYGGSWKFPEPRPNFAATHSAAYGIGLMRICEDLGIPCEMLKEGKRKGEVYTVLSDNLTRLLKGK